MRPEVGDGRALEEREEEVSKTGEDGGGGDGEGGDAVRWERGCETEKGEAEGEFGQSDG